MSVLISTISETRVEKGHYGCLTSTTITSTIPLDDAMRDISHDG